MSAFDYKKEYKQLYQPKNKPELIQVPPMQFVAVEGKGTGFPRRLSLEEQGKFMLGYYHQIQKKYEKKEDK